VFPILASPVHDPGAVEQALDRIFRDPVYRETTRRFEIESDWLAWLEKLGRWWNGLWSEVVGWRLDSPLLFWIVVALLALAILVVAARTARFGRGAPRETPEEPAAAAGKRRRAREHWSRAHEHAERGAYPDALHHLMLALADALLEDGPHHFRPAWTNHELSDSLRREGVADADFEALVGALDRAWYGRGEADADDFRRGREAVARLAGLPGVAA
jgi:hypothetical protein